MTCDDCKSLTVNTWVQVRCGSCGNGTPLGSCAAILYRPDSFGWQHHLHDRKGGIIAIRNEHDRHWIVAGVRRGKANRFTPHQYGERTGQFRKQFVKPCCLVGFKALCRKARAAGNALVPDTWRYFDRDVAPGRKGSERLLPRAASFCRERPCRRRAGFSGFSFHALVLSSLVNASWDVFRIDNAAPEAVLHFGSV